MNQIVRLFVFLTIVLQLVNGSFLQSSPCGYDKSEFEISKFVANVGLDEDNKKLKFFFNTKVHDFDRETGSIIEIYDINATTNTYTTFHATIEFMGKVFWEEDKKLCDIIAVKNVSTLPGTTRYNITHESNGININPPSHVGKRDVYYGQDLTFDKSLSMSNATIEYIFGNSTGDLIQCPLYSGDSFQIYYEVDVSDHIRGLGSYTARFTIISNNEEATIIRCDKYYVTTVISENFSFAIVIGTLVFMIVTGMLNFLIVIYSSYQESSNPLLFTASTICNEKLLGQLEATLSQILRYLQFALFMAGLDLQYPGFFQPLMIDIRWCALLGMTLLSNTNSPTETANVYTTLNSTGLKNLAVYSTNQTESDIWQNFIICLVIWIVVQILFQIIFEIIRYGYKRLFKKKLSNEMKIGFDPNLVILYKYYYQLIGSTLNACFQLFAVPFLTLTMYMLSSANNKKIFYNYWELLSRAFNTNVSYDALVASKRHSKLPPYANFNNTYEHINPGNSTVILSNNLFSNVIPLPCIICGSILLCLWAVIFLYFTFKYIFTFRNFRLGKNKNVSRLYSSVKVIAFWAFSYHTYSPDKVYFTVIQYVFVLCRSIIVGCLQNHGITQVILFIVLESLNIVVLAYIRPYYLKMTWSSTHIIMPLARLLISILNIPYIRSLNFTEESRTFVSFAQIAIHCAVAFIFFIKLVYCVSSTIATIMRKTRQEKKGEFEIKEPNEDYEDLIGDFEYYPISIPVRSVKMKDSQMNQSIFEDDIDNESIYFRINSERQLFDSQKSRDLKSTQSVKSPDEFSFMDETVNNDFINSESDNCSFTKQQYYSNLRRRRNDYTVREGDFIYQKYFCDDEMDPEVQQLWQSRNWTKPKQEPSKNLKNLNSKSLYSKVFETVWKRVIPSRNQKIPTQKSFEVSRPKQIVVKKLHDGE